MALVALTWCFVTAERRLSPYDVSNEQVGKATKLEKQGVTWARSDHHDAVKLQSHSPHLYVGLQGGHGAALEVKLLVGFVNDAFLRLGRCTMGWLRSITYQHFGFEMLKPETWCSTKSMVLTKHHVPDSLFREGLNTFVHLSTATSMVCGPDVGCKSLT